MQEEDLLLVQEEDLLPVQEEDLLVQDEDLRLAKDEHLIVFSSCTRRYIAFNGKVEDNQKKHFSPELSKEPCGVICYHHWYLRASLEGEKKLFRDEK